MYIWITDVFYSVSIHEKMIKDRHFILQCIFVFFFMAISVEAQNNQFKIDDRLYDYYCKCNKVVNEKKVLAMCDTLFRMAAGKHDMKAQCLACYVRGYHFYRINDVTSLNRTRDELYRFSSKSPYTQYIFGLWNLYINHLTRTYKYAQAARELKAYQKKAVELKSDYGIGNAYSRMGDLYYMQGQVDLSIEQYTKTLDFFRTTGNNKELSHTYNSLGLAYYSKQDYKKAAGCFNHTLSGDDDNYKGFACILLAIMNLNENNFTEAEKYAGKYDKWKESHPQTGDNYYINLMKLKYYLAKNDFPMALTYCDSLKDSIQISQHRIAVYLKMKDYENAYKSKCQNMNLLLEYTKNDLQKNIAEYSALFENERLKSEKNALALKNSIFSLNQLKDRERIMMMDRETNLLELRNKDLIVRNQRTKMSQQKAELEREKLEVQHQHDKTASMQIISRQDKRIVFLLVLLLLFGIVGGIFYFISRKKAFKRLMQQMKIAEEARKDAEKADNLKSVFLENMSHEIRTPLNAIVGFSDILTDPSMELDDDSKAEFSRLIQTNSTLLTVLINDILDLSKLETGTYKVQYANVDLNELCSTAVGSVRGKEKPGVDMKFVSPGQPETLYTDGMRCSQLLTNYLTNACKYTEKGSIILTYEKTPDSIIFSVTDTGVGIDSSNAIKIFERFEKLGSFVQGNGIGLHICYHIAELLHGEVRLDTTYKEGARFLFIHPLKAIEE